MAYDVIDKAITVSDLNKLIKDLLDVSFYQVLVKGEISSFKPSQSGHIYFDLKDENASIPSVIFRSFTSNLKSFKQGDLVLASGRVGLYEKTGKLTFIITKMIKQGDGELQALIEKRKEYYQSLGWFDPQNKIPIPKTINKLGIITSATGAVFHDILDVTKRRAPSLDIILLPCSVQGNDAAVTISSRIRQANNFSLCDVLILARGGGSQEDLAPFSEDEVIVAIHNSKIPIISAVGHETDWSLSDYVASLRAGTPSIAAEIVTKPIFERRERFSSICTMMKLLMEKRVDSYRSKLPQRLILDQMLKERVNNFRYRIASLDILKNRIDNKIKNTTLTLSYYEELVENSVNRIIEENKQKIDFILDKFYSSLPYQVEKVNKIIEDFNKTSLLLIRNNISLNKERVNSSTKELKALSPYSVLSRGYAIVKKEDGEVVINDRDVSNNEIINVIVKKGSFFARVEKEKK